ncbi:MAG: hypothetical protein CNE89_11005 [Sphingomonadaceae bacterium MED-G03]|nr:MAG: hypothetical protein CNE89_11005 [Sphingomonadaceae bacterium MED-G03]
MVEIIPFRPAALRSAGHRVDVHDFVRIWVVVVWRGRAVLSQREFPEREDAVTYAQQRACELECSLIHHPTCAGGGSH